MVGEADKSPAPTAVTLTEAIPIGPEAFAAFFGALPLADLLDLAVADEAGTAPALTATGSGAEPVPRFAPEFLALAIADELD